jgi:hypothetical protein
MYFENLSGLNIISRNILPFGVIKRVRNLNV